MRRFATAILIAALAPLACAGLAQAVSYPSGFEDRTLLSGLTRPTAVAWAPNGRLFVIEKDGMVLTAAPGSQTFSTLMDLRSRVNTLADRGLLGLAVDSQFASNGYIYLLYTYERLPLTPDSSQPMVSQLLRVKLNQSNVPIEEKVILGTYTSGPCPAPQNAVDCIPSDADAHSIGTVRSAPDGTLWVGSGDATTSAFVDSPAFRTYDERSMAGKILHVDREGQGLDGHPFCPAETNKSYVCAKLHAKGFRNPYRFTLMPGGGLAVGDVGWRTWEEIDLVRQGGKSYGWPCYEGPIRTPGYKDRTECPPQYALEGSAQAHVGPDHSYAQGSGDAAIVGGPTYTGDAYPAGYRGSIFFGDYVTGALTRLVVPTSGPPTAIPFATGWFGGVDLELAPNGNLVWVGFGDGSPGTGSIQEVVYSPGNASPNAVAAAAPTSGPAPLAVSFDGSGSNDPDRDALTYEWDFGDGSAHSSQQKPSHTYDEAGTYTASLTVSDGRGKSDTDTVTIAAGNTPPVPHVEPIPPYRAGQELALHGSATDQQDGPPPASAFAWSVKLRHGQHDHFIGEYTGVRDLSFVPTTDHDADSHYEVTLRVTDSQGLVGSHTAELQPETAPLRLESDPSGALLSYAGAEHIAPFETMAAVGFHTTVTAPADFEHSGRRYEFVDWAGGGDRVHEIDIPPGGFTLTARFRDVTTVLPPLSPGAPSGGALPVSDQDGPVLRFHPRRGLNARRGLLSGSASDPAGIRSLHLALGRRVSRRLCQWWSASARGFASRPRRCDDPRWIAARLSPAGSSWRWRASLRRALPPGGYRLLFRARDLLGNETRTLAGGRKLVRLRAPRAAD